MRAGEIGPEGQELQRFMILALPVELDERILMLSEKYLRSEHL